MPTELRTARFKPGDLVRVNTTPSRPTTWRVVDEDTNRTPVRDHEPAYRLRHPTGKERYAYESELEPVE